MADAHLQPTKELEVTGFDAHRWALLNAPIGMLIGLGYLIRQSFLSQQLPNPISHFTAGLVVVLPLIVIGYCLLVWLQVSLLNVFLRYAGMGPIVYVREREPRQPSDDMRP